MLPVITVSSEAPRGGEIVAILRNWLFRSLAGFDLIERFDDGGAAELG